MLRDKHHEQTNPARLWSFVGNSPLVEVWYKLDGGAEQSILVKCEQYNMTGSIKDRVALYMLQRAREKGALKPGDLIAYAGCDAMAVSLAALGRALGHRVIVFIPDHSATEMVNLIKSYGAEIRLAPGSGNGMEAAVKMAEATGAYPDVFLPFRAEGNYREEVHEKTTGRETGHQLLLHRIQPDAFVAGVGSGATLIGAGKYLQTLYPDMGLYPVMAAESETCHRIPGICPGAQLPKFSIPMNGALHVYDGDAILMAQALSRVGLSVGISSGANLIGAMLLRQRMGKQAVIVTVFPDSNKRYKGTALFMEEPMLGNYVSARVELQRFQVLEGGL